MAKQLPLIVEKDEDGIYVVECPLFDGCYSQGQTIDEALKNIREVLALVVEEEKGRQTFNSYLPQELSFHTLFL
ncbi:MAG: type II toxin-antitoxin system HicB family antitoxin [Patescibacteria group bacterium]